MGLTTLAVRTVFILRATLWKVGMKRKIVMFLIFSSFFSKCTFLKLRHFISLRTFVINSIFSVVVCISKILVLFFEAFLTTALSQQESYETASVSTAVCY